MVDHDIATAPPQPPRPKRRVTLKDLYRRYAEETIEDETGAEAVFGIRSLTQGEQDDLQDQLDTCRAEADRYYSDDVRRQPIIDTYSPLGVDDLIKNILVLEETSARDNIDLSPAVNGKPLTTEEMLQRLEEGVQKWRGLRTEELQRSSYEVLLKMVVERAINMFRMRRQFERWANYSLVMMIVDTESRKPILTLEPNGAATRKPEDGLMYFYDLQPGTRKRLLQLRNEFSGASPREVRDLVKDPGFLSSGELLAPSTDSPGETTSIPSTSPPESSLSTPSVSG